MSEFFTPEDFRAVNDPGTTGYAIDAARIANTKVATLIAELNTLRVSSMNHNQIYERWKITLEENAALKAENEKLRLGLVMAAKVIQETYDEQCKTDAMQAIARIDAILSKGAG